MAYAVTYATGWEAGILSFYTQNGWTASSGFPPTIQTNTNFLHRSLGGIGSNYSLNFGNSGAQYYSPIVSATSRWVSFWLKTDSGLSGVARVPILFTTNTSVFQSGLVFNVASQRVEYYVNNTLQASSAAGTWQVTFAYWVSIYYKADPSAGRMRVYLNGVQVLDSGVTDTSDTGLANWSKIAFGYSNTVTSTLTPLNSFGLNSFFAGSLDDLIVTDDDGGTITVTPPFNECFGTASAADSDVSTGLVPSPSAPNYNNINDFPAQQVTYNQANTVGAEDVYGIANMTASPTSIPAVTVWAQASRDGAITQAEIKVVSGASSTYGTVEVLQASPVFSSIARFLATDPNGSIAWTKAAVDALSIGIRFT